jgi:DNA-binding transcriptional LysR family regulator
MEFRHIEAFLAVADRGSFTRAAGQLHLTQSAVSQLVARLEDELGETLFLRHGSRVETTQAGLRLLTTAAEVLNARRTFIEHASPGGAAPSGRLRVGTISAATAYLWATTYQAFTVAYPKIELDVSATSRTLDTADAIVGGALDVGFMPFPLSNSRLSGLVLGRHQALLVAAPDHPRLLAIITGACAAAGANIVDAVSAGRRYPVEYPDQREGSTAGEWNAVAAQNNRVEFRLVPAS